jgi:hypothetical protein
MATVRCVEKSEIPTLCTLRISTLPRRFVSALVKSCEPPPLPAIVVVFRDHADRDAELAMLAMKAGMPWPPLAPSSHARDGKLGPQGF